MKGEVSNRVRSGSAEQDLTAGFSEPLQEIPGSPCWKPFLVDVNKGKTPSVHASSDHVDKNQTADTKEQLRDSASMYDESLFSDPFFQLKWDHQSGTDQDSVSIVSPLLWRSWVW